MRDNEKKSGTPAAAQPDGISDAARRALAEAEERRREARKKAESLLEYLGLKDRLTHKPGQLSGGEQQRVAVARSLVNNPAVVFADEPTGNLDSGSSQELHQLILQLRKDLQQTFIIVTHNQELAQLSDRVLVMEDGRLKE